jgi:hypothetical protein
LTLCVVGIVCLPLHLSTLIRVSCSPSPAVFSLSSAFVAGFLPSPRLLGSIPFWGGFWVAPFWTISRLFLVGCSCNGHEYGPACVVGCCLRLCRFSCPTVIRQWGLLVGFVDGLVQRMVCCRFWMDCVFVFVNLVVFGISALIR